MFGMRFGRAGKTVAVVDIGAGSVGCSIVYLREKQPALLVAAERAFLPQEERSELQLASSLASLLGESGMSLIKRYTNELQSKYGSVQSLYCVVRAPWTSSRTVTSDETFPKPQRITDALIGTLAQKALVSANLDRTKLLEAHVCRVELNGYPTHKPANKQASQVSIGVLASEINPILKSRIEAAAQSAFPNLPITWRSHTRAALSVLTELPEDYRNCVVVDVSTEGISIITIRKNLVESQITVHDGVRALLAKLAPGRPAEETLAMIKMLGREACSGESCDELVAAMGRTEPELVRTLGDSFSSLSANRKLPGTLVLLVHADLTDWFTRIFSRIDFAAFTISSRPFDIKTLGARDLGHWIIPDTDVLEDAALSLAGALVHIEAQDA